MRECVRKSEYVMTIHAEEEMMNDSLSIFDIERCILTGKIVERQKDVETSEWKYRISSKLPTEIEVVTKLSVTGKLVIITVYSL
ncbi:MAG: DUF4258 domain-containing protein [Ignavibacteriae bacterium]|nr:DUF4258 domain-containing protein [Ignavibacteriota bacterium]